MLRKIVYSTVLSIFTLMPLAFAFGCGPTNKTNLENYYLNTILLKPKVLTKDNYQEHFEVKESGSSLEIKEKPVGIDFLGQKKTSKKILSVMPDPDNPHFQGTNKWIKNNGALAFGQVTSSVLKNSAEQQQFLSANKNKADTIFVGKADDGVAGEFIDEPATKPIIAFDRQIYTANRTAYNWYVTYDSKAVGRLQGISILESLYNTSFTNKDDDYIVNYVSNHSLKEDKIVIAVGGEPADNNAVLFYEGAMNLIKKVANKTSSMTHQVIVPEAFDSFQKVGQSQWDPAKGQQFLQTNIAGMSAEQRNKIAAVLAPNDLMANAAINALADNSLDPKRVFITGLDATEQAISSIYQGTGQDMTIYKPDEISTAIMVGLASYLLDNPQNNVNPAWDSRGEHDQVVDHYEEIKTEIQKMFKYADGSNIDFEIIGNEYSSQS